jgi:hypothetical protein
MAVTVNFNNNKRITRPVLSHGAALAVKLRATPPPPRSAQSMELSTSLHL